MKRQMVNKQKHKVMVLGLDSLSRIQSLKSYQTLKLPQKSVVLASIRRIVHVTLRGIKLAVAVVTDALV